MATLAARAPTIAPSHMIRRPTDILGGPVRAIDQTGERVKEDFGIFLETYREGNLGMGSNNANSGIPTSEMLTNSDPAISTVSDSLPVYLQQLTDMRNEGRSTMYVDFNHLYRYNDVLATAIADNHYRFEPFLRAALTNFVQAHAPSYVLLPNSNQPRQFWVSIYGLSIVHRLRELTTQKVGQLVAMSGTVTRTSEVRPELLIGTFRCNECGTIVRDIEQQFRYTEPVKCLNEICNKRSWSLIPEQCVFVNWQRVRLQENANEIPPGSMPRCIDVIVRNDMADRAKAGDKCVFTGMPIVTPDIAQMLLPGNRLESGGMEGGKRPGSNSEGVTGLKALGVREMTYKLSFIAHMSGSTNIRIDDEEYQTPEDNTPESMFTLQELEEIERIKCLPNLYQRLVNSMAPAIYGHHEIKAGILLMLFGGVHKTTLEGINLRGDINICIVGDPGTAKSQFLRYVIGFLPRSVYTSGKASSAAGLTASVLKDEETGEFTIEAGALMLADNGICAIDEFDKMDLTDQVAIHEAMEQQTISISKAGIQATLNARTSILAAANPIGGRYDRKKTLRVSIFVN